MGQASEEKDGPERRGTAGKAGKAEGLGVRRRMKRKGEESGAKGKTWERGGVRNVKQIFSQDKRGKGVGALSQLPRLHSDEAGESGRQ